MINIDTGNPVGRFLHSGPRFSSLAVSRLHRRVFAGRVDGSVVSSPIPVTWLQESSDLPPSETGNNAIEALTMTEVAQLDDKPLENMVISDAVLYCSSASGRISAFHFPEFVKETIARIPFYAPWASAEITLAGDVLIGTDRGTVVMLAADLTRPASPTSLSFSEALERGITDVVVHGDGPVLAIANSPDQQFVGLARRSGQVELSEFLKSDTRILSPENGPELYSVDAICFSPDSQWFAWTGKEKQLFTNRVSETNTFRAVQLTGDGRAVQYSPDSSQLASGGSVDPLTVFDSNSLKPVSTLNQCAGCTAIAWNRSGESLLLGFDDGSIQIRSLSEDNFVERSYVHRKGIVCIAVSPDGNLAVSVDDSGQIAMWDAQTGEVFGVLFEPAWVPNGIVGMKPALRFLESGDLILVFDDGRDGPRIHRWSGLAEI